MIKCSKQQSLLKKRIKNCAAVVAISHSAILYHLTVHQHEGQVSKPQELVGRLRTHPERRAQGPSWKTNTDVFDPYEFKVGFYLIAGKIPFA